MLDRTDSEAQMGAVRMLRRLIADFGREHGKGYALAALQLALIAASNSAVAALLKPVVNGMVEAEKFGQMRILAFEALALFVLRGAATFGSAVTLSRIGNRIVATAQRRVFDRLLNQSVLYFQDRHSSEFVARLVLAANGLRDALQLVVQSAARDSLQLIGLAAVMFREDPLVAAGALCVAPVLIFFIRRILSRVKRFAKRS
ncbi:MAG: ABC transporter ATP-binding protein, partial [Bradyrhizobium sp.]